MLAFLTVSTTKRQSRAECLLDIELFHSVYEFYYLKKRDRCMCGFKVELIEEEKRKPIWIYCGLVFFFAVLAARLGYSRVIIVKLVGV